MNDTFDLLVLGLGNLLCGDDGAGVVAVARLKSDWDAPDGVAVLDGGTLGLSLLPYMRQARQVILVDAVGADAPVGTLVRVTGDEVGPVAANRLSPHQVGVADLLDGARLLGGFPESITIVGIVPAAIELSVERTPEVEARIDDLVRATVLEAASLGHLFTPKERDANDSGSACRDGLVGL